MRLHRLEITAFGPFSERQSIDFDELSDAGLFLLHGPTGAGKTSVLDAICFALYGRVPGSRGAGARYRSDHADPAAKSEVVCEFTVSGRRLEITRSPEWQRPKKRGTGFTREQARVVVRERAGDDWVGLTHRMDEAGDLIGQLIGLGPDQFTKLVLLPQGEFAAFLRATAEERRPLLQKLFGTDRFAAVEGWLGERRREAAGSVNAAREETVRLFARASQARVGPSVPADPAPDPGDTEAVAGLVRAWARQAHGELRSAHTAVGRAETAHEKARLASDAITERVRRRDRRRELGTERDLLTAHAQEQHERRARLQAAGHAPVLLPLLAELDAASAEVETAEFRVESAATGVRKTGEAAVLEAVPATRLAQLRAELGALSTLLSAEFELKRLDHEFTTRHDQVTRAEQERAVAERAGLTLAGQVEQLLAARNDSEVLASSAGDRQRDLERAKRVAEAVLTAQHLAQEQNALEDTLRAVIDVHQAAVSAQQELQARRLAGMAAELAAGLGRHNACPVCGSPDHPRPARHHGGLVTDQEQERAAEREAQTAARREKARQRVESGRQEMAALTAMTDGADAESAMDDLSAAQARLTEANRAQARVTQLNDELAGLQAALEAARSRIEAATDAASSGREDLAALDSRRDDLRARLDQARGEDAGLQARHNRLVDAVETLTEYEDASRALIAALSRLQRARAAADDASAAAGFPHREAAAAAALTEPEREELAALITDHDTRLARVTALLDELTRAEQAAAGPAPKPRPVRKPRRKRLTQDQPMLGLWEETGPGLDIPDAARPEIGSSQDGEIRNGELEDVRVGRGREGGAGKAGGNGRIGRTGKAVAAGDDAPDGVGTAPGTGRAGVPHWVEAADLDTLADELTEAFAAARAAHQAAQERHTLATRAARALSGLADELELHATETAPLRSSFATLDAVSRCVEGTGGDNQMRMRLSAYVLAARLEQVAQAASSRLAAMSGGRYELVHTDGPSKGGARSGLGLAVVDGWTGQQRDPGTLSGGETFCTSLALALGLADVVQAEAGGATIETLLVDEGFGSLDQDTLDEVMDVLDGLRSGGRAVGLVSHVADLRDRIPAQLEVVKTRAGSHLRVGVAAAAI
ncbi:hypothetical protein GCM10022223_29120 [Kineosporia mesophila]|uniref:Nuclease SbcCD subunit C n=1 Tax=Kineosporia mesophila TaxID=566012 RepID=A0ABP6ZK08_9ACTN|nr:SMC family ATPase [Kineosporia mesophila]MCD5349670.1 SMC family ATPase [Kineosporia mesophila]